MHRDMLFMLETRAVVLESSLGLESETFSRLVLDSLVFQGFFICHIIVIQGIIRSEM